MSDDQRYDGKTGKQIVKQIALWGMLVVSGAYALQAPLAQAQGS